MLYLIILFVRTHTVCIRHRIGQKHPVTIFRLITKDTIEERILDIYQNRKLKIADVVYKASFLQVARDNENSKMGEEEVEIEHVRSLYEEECSAMVPYKGEDKNQMTTKVDAYFATVSIKGVTFEDRFYYYF